MTIILIGIALFSSFCFIMEFMEYKTTGSHESFLDYLFDKYKK